MKKEFNTTTPMNEEVTAKAIVAYLNVSAKEIDNNTLNNLSNARGKALNAFAQVSAEQTAGNGISNTLRVFGDYFSHHRALASSAMALSAIFVAIMISNPFSSTEYAGDGDAFLLGSDLPPEAYYDRGFDSWLERSS